jgi:GNAT superfamily N-acetyltransferase
MAHSEPAPADIVPLTAAELGDAEALVAEAGWNQTAADWRIFLDLGQVLAVRAGGRVVATAATLPYERFGWISMVLVTAEHRRRGLASRLMRRCIDTLVAAGRVPVLDATPDGRQVYRGLGFRDTWGFQRLTLRDRSGAAGAGTHASLPDGTTIAPITDTVWPALCHYDAATFGSDRAALLTKLHARLPGAALCAMRQDRIAGFLLGRDGRTSSQLGPLVAEDDAVARALLARALSAVTGPVYIDLADARADVRAWLGTRGFAAQRPLTRMVLDRSEGFDDPARTYAVAGPELG